MIVVFGLTLHNVFVGIDAFNIFLIITTILIVLLPLTFRFSRMLMLYFVGGATYDEELAKKPALK
jgi:hypothetical protein